MKSVVQPLAKSVLIPLVITAAASVSDAGIHEKTLGSGHNTTFLYSGILLKELVKQ